MIPFARCTAAVLRFGGSVVGHGQQVASVVGNAGKCRAVSSGMRKRRRAYYLAEADPHTSLGKLKKLRERIAMPSIDLLRHLAENKIGKVQTTADRKALWFDLQHRKYAPLFLGQVKPRMRFWTAALEEAQLPLPRLPEVALAGRSNCGKSTLVNYLCGRHSAHVKREPGSTTEIVFWQIGRPAQLCLVDLPGYGFATSAEEKRLQWTEFTLWYVRSRRNLRRVLLLVDARQGLKPSDREMIAYLERHGVKWQIVVTKCDKVVQKDLARRLSVMQEETAAYRKMVGQPIPVSALKRKGMHALRDSLDSLKVMKEVVKEGIRRRVYDLLELRRVRRAERAKRRQEAKEAARQQEAERAAAMEAASSQSSFNGSSGDGSSLGDSLGDCGRDAVAAQTWAGEDEAAGNSDRPKPLVTEAHYPLDDRDSRRVEAFVHDLFPDLQDLPLEGLPNDSARSSTAVVHSWGAASTFDTQPGAGLLGRPVPAKHVGVHVVGDGSGDDSDGESAVALPLVQRFDPVPLHAREIPAEASPLHGDAMSPFPGLGDAQRLTAKGNRAAAGAGRTLTAGTILGSGGGSPVTAETVRLRENQVRPSRGQDQIYDPDDFASADDLASGKRRFSPPAPLLETQGQILAEARRRYEREWSMELEEVQERARATDVGRAPRASVNSTLDAARGQARKDTSKASAGQETPKGARTGTKALFYIGKNGNKPIPKGVGKWRILGRPPAKILKKQQAVDVGKVFNLSNRKGRRRNLGSGLSWEEAKDQWMGWYHRNKSRNFHKVEMADSPKKEDVEAAYEQRIMRRRRRSRNSRGQDHASSRDEAAEPKMSG
mmetsp:Transcript_43357/g.137905  ORF Transcript_43357/g.137905 Transcript_43357/m.137905 type:complete len:829 (-) Transcript_43357:149-2635(-)